MPKVHEIGDCPLCFGRLLPLSVCQSCNSVSVREGLDEVVPQIVCEDCGASNATHFVCSACNARFSYGDIVKAEGPTCPVCHKPVPVGAQLCPHCSAVLPVGAAGGRSKRRIRGEYGDEDVHEVSRIPGVGRTRAEALCEAGYNALWKVARASEGELAKVRGIGATDAAAIKDALRFLLLVGRKKSKEEVLSEECECPLCGTLTSLFATHCHGCGALFDEEELDEEFRGEVEREPEKGLLAFYDVRLLENPESVPLHYARATLLLSLARPAEALAGLDRVLELEPGHPRALQAKARALAGAKGIGSAAQILRDLVAPPSGQKPVEAAERSAGEDVALEALAALEEAECPECGERHAPGAKVCPVCGHRFAPEEPARGPAPLGAPEERLLAELERAVAGESKAPPPPLRPEVPDIVVDKKRYMLALLLKLPGVSRRAAEAVSGFFQDLDQVAVSDMADLADIPGVAPAEARLIKEAVDAVVQPIEEPPPPPPP
ncbi:MAG TPA: helix-hairpin-helix domain-containing protein, partial [Thermoplasmata archaeon]|nr:helix-hairpin-helix domain-containing protein [Thermoplasmata archaeon]